MKFKSRYKDKRFRYIVEIEHDPLDQNCINDIYKVTVKRWLVTLEEYTPPKEIVNPYQIVVWVRHIISEYSNERLESYPLREQIKY